jgi:DNA repair protein SbcC/Rad50
MINADILKNQLSKYYDKIDNVTDHVIKCQKEYNSNPYQYYYFDFSNKINDINIDQYTKQLISKDYYSQSNLMQWNYYLAFVIENSIDPSLKNKIEQNEDFARKFVINYNELDQWLYRTYYSKKSETSELTEDLADIWRNILANNNLDCVFSKEISLPNGINGIISGEYRKEKVSIGSKKEIDQKLISFGDIQTINLIKFREYPKSKTPIRFGKVNLIEGANGYGKTSLLESIEFLLTGKTQRSEILKSFKVEGSFSKNSKLVSQINNHALFRDRDRAWYGSMAAQRLSKLNENFNRFNFFNTDAAYRLMHEKDQHNIEKAFKDIAIGEDLNYLEREIENYKSKVEVEIKSRKKDIVILNDESDKARLTLEEINKTVKGPGELYKILIKELEHKKWTGKIPTSVDDNLDNFYAEITKLQVLFNSIQNDIDFIDTPSINSFNEEQNRINKLFDSIAKISEVRLLTEKTVKDLQKQIAKNESSLILLKKILPYYSNDIIIEKIVGLNDRIEKQLANIRRLGKLKEDFEKIDISSFEKDRTTLIKKLETSEVELDLLKKNENELSQKIASFKKTITDLQNILGQIRLQGLKFLQLNSNANECPMCRTKFENSLELKKRIEATSSDIASSNILTSLLSEQELTIHKIKQVEIRISGLNEISLLINMIEDIPKATRMSLTKLIAVITKHFKQLESFNNQLTELKLLKQNFQLNGLDENQYKHLKEELDTHLEFATIVNKLVLEKRISKLQLQIIKLKKDLTIHKDSINNIENNIESLLKNYDNKLEISTYKNLLENRKSNVKHYLNELANDKYILRISNTDNVRILQKEINKIEQLLNKVREDKKQKASSDIISKKANITITVNKQKIKDITEEIYNLNSALKVFLKISNNYNVEAYFEKFFSNNRKEIQNIFLAIHSPHEFTELSIESGEIKLTRDNFKKDGIQNISAGQRSALAISLFLALNNKLKNGPNVMMFDDPVSFTDDLNILSFIDYLRQIALEKPDKQIFFATANDNVAFLFRKKFEILGEDFKRISLKR